jgi:4a-hydroxytetrahydrobiopterin dehydratase
MTSPATLFTYDPAQATARLTGALAHWQYDQGWIVRRYQTSGWKSSLMVANTIGHLAEAAWHHPDLLVSYPAVVVRLQTHDANGVTDRDFELAQQIEAVIQWQPSKNGGALEGTPNTDPRFSYLNYDS